MSFARRVARGATSQLLAQLVRIGAKGLIIVLLTRFFLDPESYGLLFLALSVLGVAVLFANLGFAKSAGRYIAEYRETDPAQIPHILASALAYNVVAIVLVVVALGLLGGPIARLFGDPRLEPLLLAGVGYVATRSLLKFCTLVFQGFNRVTWSAIIGSIANVALLGFVVAFLLLGFGTLGAVFGYVVGYAVATAVGFVVLYVRFYRPHRRAGAPEPGLSRRVLRYSVPLAVTRGANVLDSRVDAILVGYLLNPTAVGFYTLGKQISEFIVAPASSLGFAISPAYGEKKAGDELDRAARIYETSFVYTLSLYGPAAAGVFLVAEPMIRLVLGVDYLGAVPVLQVFAAFLVLQSIQKITEDGLDYLGRARARAVAKSVSSVGNFLLNLALIPAFGVIGAAVATVVTHSLMIAVELFVIYRELGVSIRRLFRAAVLIGFITLAMSITVWVLFPRIPNAVTLAVTIITGIVVWMFLATATGIVNIRQITNL